MFLVIWKISFSSDFYLFKLLSRFFFLIKLVGVKLDDDVQLHCSKDYCILIAVQLFKWGEHIIWAFIKAIMNWNFETEKVGEISAFQMILHSCWLHRILMSLTIFRGLAVFWAKQEHCRGKWTNMEQTEEIYFLLENKNSQNTDKNTFLIRKENSNHKFFAKWWKRNKTNRSPDRRDRTSFRKHSC